MFRVARAQHAQSPLLTQPFLTDHRRVDGVHDGCLDGSGSRSQPYHPARSRKSAHQQGAFGLGLLTVVASTILLALLTFVTGRRGAAAITAGDLTRSSRLRAVHPQFRQIRKTFAGNTALESFDLAMEPGEFVSLLGPSGCGKTTALRIAAGFERPDSGAVMSMTETFSVSRPTSATWGWCSRATACSPTSTSAGNVAFGLRVAQDQRRRAVTAASARRSSGCT